MPKLISCVLGILVLLLSTGVFGRKVSTDPRCKVPVTPPSPPPAPPPPGPLPPHHYKETVQLDSSNAVSLSYNILEDSLWDIQIAQNKTSPEAKTSMSGWIGVGWSNAGKMQYGDFVIGYPGCARVVSMDGGSPPPNGDAGFEIHDAAFFEDSDIRVLRFKRGEKSSIPGHPWLCTGNGRDCPIGNTVSWLWAGGAAYPKSCSDVFTTSMFHNQFYGHSNASVPAQRNSATIDSPTPLHAERTAFGFRPRTVEGTKAAAQRTTKHTAQQIQERHTPVSFSVGKNETYVHPTSGYTVHKTTFFSTPLPLAPGDVVWTFPDLTPIPMPKGKYAVLGQANSEIVDCENNSIPLSHVYNHHWIFNPSSGHTNFACPEAGLDFVFGVGAESRNTPWPFPRDHGYIVEDGIEWSANIHLLNTIGLAGGAGAAKECIECWYAPQKQCGNDDNGTFACCYSDSRCSTAKPPTKDDIVVYYLTYTIEYTYDLEKIVPIDVAIFMTPDCSVDYSVIPPSEPNAAAQGYPSDGPPGPEHLARDTWTIPHDGEIVFAVAHYHTGAINLSVYVNDEFMCASLPEYGTTPDKPGDELGYLTGISPCVAEGATPPFPAPAMNKAMQLKRGDVLRLDGWYWIGDSDKRIAPTPGGPHLIVMQYLIAAFRATQ
eukprot:m.10234 g.10234  ORF g.10234 m.10234 type:complete len:656 (+) comp7283_c0_seq1:177-2144(+)